MPSAVPIAKPPRPSGSSHSVIASPASPGGGDALDQVGGERGPPGLVAGAEAAAGVAMEVLVEQHEARERRIAGVALGAAVARPVTARVGQEQRDQPALQLLGDLAQVHAAAAAGRALDSERVAVEVVVALERLDDEVVRREPDRTA